MKKAAFSSKRMRLRDKGRGAGLHLAGFETLAAAPAERAPSTWFRQCFAGGNAHWISIVAAEEHFTAEFGCVIVRRKPAGGVRQIKKGAQCRCGFLHSGKSLAAAAHLADICIRQLLDLRHPRCGLSSLRHVGADHQPVTFVQLLLDRTEKLAK